MHDELTNMPTSSNEFIMYLCLSFACLLCAAVAAGLTQGMISLDPLELAIKVRSGTSDEVKYANKLLPLVRQHHYLLVTLLLFNALANETLPLFFDMIFPSWLAIVLSVTGVLIFGEIIPSAILTGPNQLKLTAMLSPLTMFLMVILSPIAYPLSKLLDYILGHDEGMTMYSRNEMTAMMDVQFEESQKLGHTTGMNKHEVKMMQGALKFRDLQAHQVMTPEKLVYMLPLEGKLDVRTMGDIFKCGYSRVPVFENSRTNIVSLLLVKDLIFIDPLDGIPIKNFIALFGTNPLFIWPDDTLPEVLSSFKESVHHTHVTTDGSEITGKGHMAIVRDVVSVGDKDPYYEMVGVVTLEDIVGEILGEEFEDDLPPPSQTLQSGINASDGDATTDAAAAAARGKVLAVNNRDMDFARLRMLNPKLVGELVSNEEARTVATHIKANNVQICTLMAEVLGYVIDPSSTPLDYDTEKVSIDDIRRLLLLCPVVDMKKLSTSAAAEELDVNGVCSADYLYQRGKASSTCTVILNGNVTVLAGADSFKAESSAWSVLGAGALAPTSSDTGSFIPDFSAFMTSPTLRCFRITRDSVFALLAPEMVQASGSGGATIGMDAATLASLDSPALHHKIVRKNSDAATMKKLSSAGAAAVNAANATGSSSGDEGLKKVSNLVPRKPLTGGEADGTDRLRRKPSMRVLKLQVRLLC